MIVAVLCGVLKIGFVDSALIKRFWEGLPNLLRKKYKINIKVSLIYNKANIDKPTY